MDIFALGCLLEEIITLEAPGKHVDHSHDMDAPLKAIVAKARHEEPSQRYQSIDRAGGPHRVAEAV